jgi:hypothetical protein
VYVMSKCTHLTVAKVLTSQSDSGGRSITFESGQCRQELPVLLLHQQADRTGSMSARAIFH